MYRDSLLINHYNKSLCKAKNLLATEIRELHLISGYLYLLKNLDFHPEGFPKVSRIYT